MVTKRIVPSDIIWLLKLQVAIYASNKQITIESKIKSEENINREDIEIVWETGRLEFCMWTIFI